MIYRALLTAMLVWPACSWGWDVEEGAPAPQLHGVLPARTSIARVDVVLQGHAVSVTYQGQQAEKTPQALTLSRHSPTFGWQGVAADYPDLHFPELGIRVNGKIVRSKSKSIALFEGEDVTADLKRFKLDPLRVALGEAALIDTSSLPVKRIRRLFSASADGADMAYPLWQTLFSQVWKIPAVAHGDFSLQVTYNARPAKREINTDSQAFSASVIGHCGNLDQVKDLLKHAGDQALPAAVVIERFSLPLQLANMAPASTLITVEPASKTQPGLRFVSSLACGPEEASLSGKPSIKASKAATSLSLSVLEIFIQS